MHVSKIRWDRECKNLEFRVYLDQAFHKGGYIVYEQLKDKLLSSPSSEPRILLSLETSDSATFLQPGLQNKGPY
jgi:hypothetical protein